MLRYDLLALFVVVFIWAALPGGISHGEPSTVQVAVPAVEQPKITNAVEGRIVHLTHYQRQPGDPRTLSDAVGELIGEIKTAYFQR